MMQRLHRPSVWRHGCSWLLVAALALGGLLSGIVLTAPAARGGTVRGPIAIVGNAGFTAANGVTNGSGSLADPYVIEGWSIDTPFTYGIYVANTTAAFVIRNVTARPGYGYAGILLKNVTNGRVEDTTSFTALGIEDSARVSVSRINLPDGPVYVTRSTDIVVGNVSVRGASISGSSRVVFQDNRVLSFNSGVFFMFDPSDPSRRGSNYTILRNRFTPISPWIVYVQGVDGITIADNEFSQLAVDISDISLGTIRNNTVSDVRWYNGNPGSLSLQASRNVEISDNRISGEWGTSLRIGTSDNLTVSGNNITNQGGGFGFQDSTNATVRANRVTGLGIWVRGTELSHYATHTFGTDNLVNGLPFAAYKNCTDLTV
ncbi:MAG: right-handed parallel beta-helix repeat-containing protein [Methanobacteriota archaeon]|nr:MAG: right-handed parallel beta-helix repeat-containing protein [Euryarchaeota archaeon]